MPTSYELWLLDDYGRRIALLKDLAFFSYARSESYYGTIQVGLPYEVLKSLVFPTFAPDRRIDVWRSPGAGFPTRREETFLVRMERIYTRMDGVQMVVLYGNDPKDLLRRRWIIQPGGYSQTNKTDQIDDMMKAIVREQMLYGSCVDVDGVASNTRAYPQNEFLVDGDVSLGPSYTATFPDRNVLDVLGELHDASLQLNKEDPTANRRIFFAVRAFDESDDTTIARQVFKFFTYADRLGQDRTASSLVFSVENNNLEAPAYTLSHMDEENSVVVKGPGRGDSKDSATVDDTTAINQSRWNRCEGVVDASSEPDPAGLPDYGYRQLDKMRVVEELNGVFLNVPEGKSGPRSLYGIDWDLGDILPVSYAGVQFELEVRQVFVSVDDQGIETITGRNDVNAGAQQ